MRIACIPVHSLFDSPLTIRISGANAHQKLTVCCTVQHATGDYISFAHYVTNEHGDVDLRTMPSVGGMYVGIEPMGLLWSLRGVSSGRKGIRLLPRDVTKPIEYTFAIHDGTLTESDLDVKTRLPAILDLFGTGGGLIEHRAALLASKGFVAFALAYFAYDDLPGNLDNFDLSYDGVTFLKQHPQVNSNAIGIIGTSYGGDLAIQSAIYFDNVKAFVIVNAFHSPTSITPICVDGTRKKGYDVPMDPVLNLAAKHGQVPSIRKDLDALPYNKDIAYPVWNIPQDGRHILFLTSEDDQNTNAVRNAQLMMNAMKENGRGSQCSMITFPGAGHLLEPPYVPHTPIAFHRFAGTPIAVGGNAVQHSHAADKMWSIVQKYFTERLGQPAIIPPFSINENVINSKL